MPIRAKNSKLMSDIDWYQKLSGSCSSHLLNPARDRNMQILRDPYSLESTRLDPRNRGFTRVARGEQPISERLGINKYGVKWKVIAFVDCKFGFSRTPARKMQLVIYKCSVASPDCDPFLYLDRHQLWHDPSVGCQVQAETTVHRAAGLLQREHQSLSVACLRHEWFASQNTNWPFDVLCGCSTSNELCRPDYFLNK